VLGLAKDEVLADGRTGQRSALVRFTSESTIVALKQTHPRIAIEEAQVVQLGAQAEELLEVIEENWGAERTKQVHEPRSNYYVYLAGGIPMPLDSAACAVMSWVAYVRQGGVH
jgi:hypothetical protein